MASTTNASNQKKSEFDKPVNEYLDSSETVKVYVGPKRKMWILNEGLLCDRSAYFKAAFKNNFKEGKEKEIYLSEEDPVAFAHVVDFIYAQGLKCRHEHAKNKNSELENLHVGWCILWVMADKLGMTDLAKTAIKQLNECMDLSQLLSAKTVKYVYKYTSVGSALRKNLVEYAVTQFYRKDNLDASGRIEKAMWSSNENFQGEVLKGIRSHLRDRSCMDGRCSLHHALKHEWEIEWKMDYGISEFGDF